MDDEWPAGLHGLLAPSGPLGLTGSPIPQSMADIMPLPVPGRAEYRGMQLLLTWMKHISELPGQGGGGGGKGREGEKQFMMGQLFLWPDASADGWTLVCANKYEQLKLILCMPHG